MKYSDILANEHFQNMATAIRVIHFGDAQADFVAALNMLKDATYPYIEADWLARFVDLQLALAEKHDSTFTTGNIAWLTERLQDERPDAFVALFLAYATAPDEFLTPAEIAKQTGTAESGWRNKAAAGQLPGSIKKGKQWLIPKRHVKDDENGQ